MTQTDPSAKAAKTTARCQACCSPPTARNHLQGIWPAILLSGLLGFSTPAAITSPSDPTQNSNSWRALFDGKTLAGWKSTEFHGHGKVRVEDQKIILEEGSDLTGISATSAVPRMNYEIALEAMKVEGGDFFCGLTFPVGDSFCTFIVGGWGGGIVGLSSIDNMDASENETSQSLTFEAKRWYQVRLRVTPGRIQTWIDEKATVDLETAGRKISLRWGEIDLSKPLGIASWRTTAALRNLRIRSLGGASGQTKKKIVFVAGRKSHGPGEHEYEKGLELLQSCLAASNAGNGIQSELHSGGWPKEESAFDDADTIVLYCDGADRSEAAHPLLAEGHLAALEKAMNRGSGLVAIHYTVFVPRARGGKEFLNWIGGFFDYESGSGANHWYSRIETRDFQVKPATPEHPILRGVVPFTVREEYYFQLRLKEADPGWVPIVAFEGDQGGSTNVVGWAIERPNGGRGFGYSGGHFHANWDLPPVRKLISNAILWTAHAEVPAAGVECKK